MADVKETGIAIGIQESDVTEQASSVVLLGDTFATIRDAVTGGRRISGTVRHLVDYQVSSDRGEATMVFTGSMVGLGLAIMSIQILLVTVVADGIPVLSRGVDTPAEDIMEWDLQPSDESVVTERIVTTIVGITSFKNVLAVTVVEKEQPTRVSVRRS